MFSSLITKHVNNNVVLSFTEFYWIFKISENSWILLNFKRPSTEYSIYAVRGLTHLFSKWFRNGSTLFVVFGLYTTRCFYSFTSFHYRMYVWYNFRISSQNSSQGPKVDILAAWRSGDTDAAVDSLTRRRLQHYRVVSCAVGYCTFANVNDRHSVDTATKSAKHGSLGSL